MKPPKKDKRTGSKTSPLRTPKTVRIARTAKKYLEIQKGSGTRQCEKQAFCPPGTQMLLCTKSSAQQSHSSEKSATKLQFKL